MTLHPIGPRGGTWTVAAGTYIDVRNVASLRVEINAALDAGAQIVLVDASEVEVLDPAGLGMLTAAHLRAQRGSSELRVLHPSKTARRILAVTRLNRILRVDRHLSISA